MTEKGRFATSEEVAAVLARVESERIGPETRMQCKVCWHVYDPAEGCPEWDAPPGTPFTELPEHFTCPDCGHPKSSFIPMTDED